MRVLFVTGMHPTPTHPLRGVIIQRLQQALESQGHEIAVAGLEDRKGLGRYLGARGAVGDAVARYRPDLIHVHFGYSTLALPPVSIPIVTSFYGDDLNGTWREPGGITLKSRLGIAISHYAAWRSRKCIVVSAGMVARLRSRTLRDRTVVIRDAVDPAMFFPRSRAEALARLGLDAEPVRILFPHNTTQSTKRQWLAEAAVEALKRRIPAAALWVVNGQAADQMPWFYSAAGAMLVTSALEGGPSSVKEALACGLPVVSVPVGDVQVLLEVPAHTRLAPAEPEALADALHDVLVLNLPRDRSFLPPDLDLASAARQIGAVYEEAHASVT